MLHKPAHMPHSGTSSCKQAESGQRVKQDGCPWRCDSRAATQQANATWNPCSMLASSCAGGSTVLHLPLHLLLVPHPPHCLSARVALLTGLACLMVHSSVKGIPKQADSGCTITRQSGSIMHYYGSQHAKRGLRGEREATHSRSNSPCAASNGFGHEPVNPGPFGTGVVCALAAP